MGRHVEVRSIYISPEDSPLEVHRSVLNEWKTRRGDRLAPGWREYSFLDFPVHDIPCISLTDISTPPLRSVYRFWGTGLTEVFGGDYTGKTPADVPPRSLGISANGGCARLANELIPNYEVKEFLRNNGIVGRVLILRLPFSDDNKTVNHGINMYKFELHGSRNSLKNYFEDVLSKIDDRDPRLENPPLTQ